MRKALTAETAMHCKTQTGSYQTEKHAASRSGRHTFMVEDKLTRTREAPGRGGGKGTVLVGAGGSWRQRARQEESRQEKT